MFYLFVDDKLTGEGSLESVERSAEEYEQAGYQVGIADDEDIKDYYFDDPTDDRRY